MVSLNTTLSWDVLWDKAVIYTIRRATKKTFLYGYSVPLFGVKHRPPDHEAVMLNTAASSCSNCTVPFHTDLAGGWIPPHWSRETRFERESWKLLCAGGANGVKSSPHDSWNRTQSWQDVAGNKSNVTVALRFNRYATAFPICTHLYIFNNSLHIVLITERDCLTPLCYAFLSS
jgi:hypothetical protein